MSIYDKNGSVLTSAYDASGTSLQVAYDKDGNIIFDGRFSGTKIKVMTYNVGQWYIGSGTNVPASRDAAYYALQNGMIAANMPDVLCLQEYWKVFSKTGRTARSMLEQYFPYIHEQGGNSGYMGRCICSRFPISNYTTHTYSVGNNQYYDSCILTIGDKQITFVNTHPTTNDTQRLTQLGTLLNFLNGLGSFIATGDYNTGISAERGALNTTHPFYKSNVKRFVDAGFHTTNFGQFGFMRTCNDGVDGEGTWWYIDNILTSPDIIIDSAYVDETKVTDNISAKIDHMPLIATFDIEGVS